MTSKTRAQDCLLILGGAVVFALIVRPFQNTPFIDDWVYAFSVERLLKTGQLLVLENSSNINVAQILWGALFSLPFGFSFAALRVSTWVLSIGGLCGFYLLLDELEVPRPDALLGTAALALYPVFATFSVTFMTDVPFVSVTILASFAFLRAVRVRSLAWLLAAAVLASSAAAIRVIGVVTPIAMLLTLFMGPDEWGRRRGRWALTLVPFVALALVVLWRPTHIFQSADVSWLEDTPEWRLSMLKFALPMLPRMGSATFGLIVGNIGLVLLPLSIGVEWGPLLRRGLWILATIAATLVVVYSAGVHFELPLGTGQSWALNEFGGSAALVPERAWPIVPAAAGWVALAVGAISFSWAAAALTRLPRMSGQMFLLLAIAGHIGLVVLLWLTQDHYLLMIAAYAIALMLAARPTFSRRRSAVALAGLALLSVAGVRDEVDYNRALWRAVSSLESSGVSPRDINGGWMVDGWLQYAHPEQAYRNTKGDLEIPWINGSNQRPYKIANAPSADWDVLESFAYHRWLGPAGRIYALRSKQILQ